MNEVKYPDTIITVHGNIESEDKVYRSSKILTASAAAKALFGVNVKDRKQGSVWTAKFRHEGKLVWIDAGSEGTVRHSAHLVSPECEKRMEERLNNAIEI